MVSFDDQISWVNDVPSHARSSWGLWRWPGKELRHLSRSLDRFPGDLARAWVTLCERLPSHLSHEIWHIVCLIRLDYFSNILSIHPRLHSCCAHCCTIGTMTSTRFVVERNTSRSLWNKPVRMLSDPILLPHGQSQILLRTGPMEKVSSFAKCWANCTCCAGRQPPAGKGGECWWPCGLIFLRMENDAGIKRSKCSRPSTPASASRLELVVQIQTSSYQLIESFQSSVRPRIYNVEPLCQVQNSDPDTEDQVGWWVVYQTDVSANLDLNYVYQNELVLPGAATGRWRGWWTNHRCWKGLSSIWWLFIYI